MGNNTTVGNTDAVNNETPGCSTYKAIGHGGYGISDWAYSKCIGKRSGGGTQSATATATTSGNTTTG